MGRRLFSSSSNGHRSFSSSDDSLRTKLLRSSLKHVSEHGWSQEAIVAAVRDSYPKVSLSYATILTATDMVAFFMEDCNQRLRNELRAKQQDDENSVPLSRVDRLQEGLQLRLEYLTGWIQAGRWSQGMALGLGDPDAALVTSEQLKDLISIVVEETAITGELSDLAQVGLGAVYVATECHLLTDTSENYKDTWAFLRDSLEHWERLQQRTSTGGTFSPSSSSASDAAFLASNVALALGNGLVSVVNLPNLPSPDEVWQTLVSQPKSKE
jgi:rpsU-divergently transcribed protein